LGAGAAHPAPSLECHTDRDCACRLRHATAFVFISTAEPEVLLPRPGSRPRQFVGHDPSNNSGFRIDVGENAIKRKYHQPSPHSLGESAREGIFVAQQDPELRRTVKLNIGPNFNSPVTSLASRSLGKPSGVRLRPRTSSSTHKNFLTCCPWPNGSCRGPQSVGRGTRPGPTAAHGVHELGLAVVTRHTGSG